MIFLKLILLYLIFMTTKFVKRTFAKVRLPFAHKELDYFACWHQLHHQFLSVAWLHCRGLASIAPRLPRNIKRGKICFNSNDACFLQRYEFWMLRSKLSFKLLKSIQWWPVATRFSKLQMRVELWGNSKLLGSWLFQNRVRTESKSSTPLVR
jgi:hypothetical protein